MEIVEMTIRLTGADEIRRVMAAVDGFDLNELDQLREQKSEQDPPAPKQDPPKQNPKPKKIDRGKIMALHKAGWSAEKIADEMKCSTVTVYKALKEEAEQ